MSRPGRPVAVGLIAKAPVAGAVKTRLCPPLTPEQAARVAAAMLADTATSALASGHDVWCVHAGDEATVRRHLPHGVGLLAQRGQDLAARLAAAQADLHARYARVVLLGADCPTVEPDYLAGAIAALGEADVVLGAAHDGGYTLIASRAPHRGLFDVEMSTPRVLAETVRRAAGLGLSARTLPARHDLDTVDDLVAALAAGQLEHASRTRVLLDREPALSAAPER